MQLWHESIGHDMDTIEGISETLVICRVYSNLLVLWSQVGGVLADGLLVIILTECVFLFFHFYFNLDSHFVFRVAKDE